MNEKTSAPASTWDERFSGEDFVYGEAPNEFLAEWAPRLPKGDVLCLAEGEGRNAAFLARGGFSVTGVDQSAAGLAKARALAERQGVRIATEVADLGDWDMGEARWDGIVSIFAHTPAYVRRHVHANIARALKPGGWLLLEAYTPRQHQTGGRGGPPVGQEELFMEAASLRAELPGLEFERLEELEREVNEGIFHQGTGAVVQLVAWKR